MKKSEANTAEDAIQPESGADFAVGEMSGDVKHEMRLNTGG